MTPARRGRRRAAAFGVASALVAALGAVSPGPSAPAGAVDLGAVLTWRGAIGLRATAASWRMVPNGPGSCLVGPSATAAVDALPPGATVRTARVQWAASGALDDTVALNGHTVVADHAVTVAAAGGDAFSATADVTGLVTPGASVTVSGLTIDTGPGPCAATAVFGGFALFVVYDQPGATTRLVVLRQGLDVVGRAPAFATVLDDLSPAAVGAPATLWALAWEGDDFGTGETVGVDGRVLDPTGSTPGQVWDATTPGGPGQWGVDLDAYALDAPLAPERTSLDVSITSGDDQILVGAIALVLDEPPRPPTAHDDVAQVEEDGSVDVAVAGNDIDFDGDLDPSSVTVTEAPSLGIATVLRQGDVRYAPRADLNGPDRFAYQVCDRTARCSAATVHVDVTDRPDAPVAASSASPPMSVATARLDVLAGVVDADGDLDPTTLRIVAPPDIVTAEVDAGWFVVHAPAGYRGRDHLRWEVCDRGGRCVQADLTVVAALDHDAVPIVRTIAADAELPMEVVALGGVVDPRRVETEEGPRHGVLEVTAASGTVVYRPASGFTGTDGFSYRACDFGGTCRVQEVRVTVTP